MSDLRTERERRRAQRDVRLTARYKELHREQPNASDNRIMGKLAEEFNLTIMGVKGILKRRRVYKPDR